MTELLQPPRYLVPTDRQVGVGDVPSAAPDVVVPALHRATSGPSLASRVRAFLVDIDPRRIRGAKFPVVVFVVIALFSEFDNGVFVVVLPELRAEFGGGIGPLLVVGTVVQIVTALAAPVFGFFTDRWPRVWLVRVANLGANIAVLATAFLAHSMVAVVVFLATSGLLLGVQGAGLLPYSRQGAAAPSSLMADYYDVESCGRALSLMQAAGALGGIITPIVAGLAVDRFGGWRPAVSILGVFAIIICLPTFLLREPKRGARQVEALGAEQRDATPMSFATSWRAVSSILTMRRIWFAMAFVGAGVYGFPFFLANYWAQAFGLTPSARGYIVAIANGAQFALLLFLSPTLSRMAVRRPSRIMVLLGGVVMSMAGFVVILSLSQSVALSVLVSIPITAGIGVLVPALSILLLRLLPPDVRGLGFSSIALFTLVGQFLYLLAIYNTPVSIGSRGPALLFVPFYLVGGYLLASAGSRLDRDIRGADAATLARMAAVPEDSTTGALLVCRDVEVSYNGSIVVDGVDLDIQHGELVALLGTNGAGKSSLLKVICGVVRASGGAIFFNGRNVTSEPPHLNVRHGIVMVPGGRAVFPTLSVRENLRAATLSGDDEGEFRLDEVFALFPALRDRLDYRAGDLSGGEQQMVALGQALLMRPKLLMIDELSLGLAPAVVDQLLEVLQEINRRGTTVVIVEQSVNVALTVAARAIFMDRGRIRFDGSTEALLARPDLIRSVFMGGAATGVAASKHRSAPDATITPAMKVEDVSVVFGGIQALGDVSFEVLPREILGILGPNGAGKTTLFDAISGFAPTVQGSVWLEGADVTPLGPDGRARLGIARSFQDARLFPSLTVRENIAVAFERLASRNAMAALTWSPGLRKNEDRIKRRVDALIDLLNLGSLADKFVAELSTGSRRAVDIAVVMAAEPKVLLLDEPSSGLAQAEVEALGPVISRLAHDSGAAVLVIEHDLPLLVSVSHRLMAMELGRVLLTGSPDEVLRDQRILTSYLNASERSLTRSGSRMSSIATALGVDASTPSHPEALKEEGPTR